MFKMVNSILDFNWMSLNNKSLLDFIEDYNCLNLAFDAKTLDYFETIKFIELNYKENVHKLIIDYQVQCLESINCLIKQFIKLTTGLATFKSIWIGIVESYYKELNCFTVNQFNDIYKLNINKPYQLNILELTNLHIDRSKRRKIDSNYFNIFKNIPNEELSLDITNIINSIIHKDEILLTYKINKLKSIIS